MPFNPIFVFFLFFCVFTIRHYVASPDFRITLVGWAVDDRAPCSQEVMTPALVSMIESPEYIKVAHNAWFEMTCLAAAGVRICPERWTDTMHIAARLGYPQGLQRLSAALYLGGSGKKDGARLIRYFAMSPRHDRYDDPEAWERYRDYNIHDVMAERAVFTSLHDPASPLERQVEILDHRINSRGIAVDCSLVEGAKKLAASIREKGIARLRELTGLENPNSTAALKRWLGERGVDSERLTKDNYGLLLEKAHTDDVKEVLTIRSGINKTSVMKFDAISRSCVNGRLYGMFRYCGASTGRWSGRLVQLQNPKRNSISDLPGARELVRNGDLEGLKAKYPDTAPLEILGQLIRTALIASPGRQLIIADYSAIEARIIAWLAHETWRQDVFASDGDIYKSSYSQAFGIPPENVDKDMRQTGKIMELALGYGGGLGALKQCGADKLGLSEDDMRSLVTRWREASPNITRFWRETERLVRQAITTGRAGAIYISAGYELQFWREDGALVIALPSDRPLYYRDPQIVRDELGRQVITYIDPRTGERRSTFGGKIAENITQAVARDCLAAAMLRLDAAGYEIVAHVHDEVIIDALPGQKVTDVERIMGEDLYPGLHLTAKGYSGPFYYKE